MSKEILYSFANDDCGNVVAAYTAQRGQTYFCPSCNGEMVSRMGKKVRPHYAHKSLSPNCSPESALHFGFKRLLYNRIFTSLSKGESLTIQWDCKSCCGSHTGDLLRRTTLVEEECSLGACRPDIGLLDKSGNVVAVIEVVVTHPPDETAIEYYQAKGIPLVVFHLKSDSELSRASEEILKPDLVDACLNPRCPKCQRHKSRQRLLIIDAKCWKCNSPMKVSALRGDAGYEGGFTDEHIALAAEHGSFIKTRYSRSANDRYAANTCKKCNAMIGGHYLFTDYVAMSEYGNYSRVELDGGYYCPNC